MLSPQTQLLGISEALFEVSSEERIAASAVDNGNPQRMRNSGAFEASFKAGMVASAWG